MMPIAHGEDESNVSPPDIRDIVGTHGHELAKIVIAGGSVGPANVGDVLRFVDYIHDALAKTNELPSEWWQRRYKRLGMKASEFCRVTALVLKCFNGVGAVHRIRQEVRQDEINRVNAIQPTINHYERRVRQLIDLNAYNEREIARLGRICEGQKLELSAEKERADKEETKRLRELGRSERAKAKRLKAQADVIAAGKLANPIEYHCAPEDICEMIAHGRVLMKY